jgi:ribonuclease E
MPKEMLINVSEGEECRIALLEDGKLDELYMERTSSTSHVGNIYKGRVTNVEASIQAAFVDFGLGRNGFLHISDLMPTYFGRKGEEIQESVGRKMARRDRPPIQRCLRRGDEIVVQIIKEGIGTKGPTLTTYLSIPGKILVMMPGVANSGVSRKIEDEDERRRLRKILDELDPPDDAGFIIRTAGVGNTKQEIARDLTYLARLWANFKKKRDSGPGPMELYTEGDLVTRTVRDVFTSEVDRLIIDNKEVAKRVKDVVKLANPRTRNKIELYEEPIPLFHKFGIEREIELMYSRHVPLPSGGSLVIDSTEAIVAIDVNSGKNRSNSDAETTAFKVDMEAADEICRQLKLRDLGGVIICDFIDLRYERHRRELEKRLHDNLKNDRAKTKVLRMSQFGIIEMTRQRMRPSLKRSVYFDCPHCKGAGLVKTPESMSLDVMRRLRIAINDKRVQRIELIVCTEVAFYLQNRRRFQLSDLESHYDKHILVRAEPTMGLDEMKVDLFDNRDGLVFLEELGMVVQPPHTTQLGTKPQRVQPRGRGGREERGRPRHDHPPVDRRTEEETENDERLERAEEGYEDHGEENQNQELTRGREEDREPDLEQEEDQDRGRNRDRDQVENREFAPRRDQQGGRDQRRGPDNRRPQGPPRGPNQGRGGDQNRNRDQRRDQNRDPYRDQNRQPQRPPVEADPSDSPALETEAGSEAAPPSEGNGGGGGGGGGQGQLREDGTRRRRRRRGRRGRGRGRQFAEGQQQDANGQPARPFDNGAADQHEGSDEASAGDAAMDREESVVEEDIYASDSNGDVTAERIEADLFAREHSPEPEPETVEPIAEPAETVEADEVPPEPKPKAKRKSRAVSGRSRKKAAVEPAPTPKAAIEPPPAEPVVVARTGSTDRHLIEDEPAFPQPVRRPKSVRDLDHIPDDFD